MMRNMTRPAKYPGVLIIQGRAAMFELVGMVQFQAASLAAVLTTPAASIQHLAPKPHQRPRPSVSVKPTHTFPR